MFKKILIANRGEIACRIIKTARRFGILTVAVYSDSDSDALHVAMADEAVHIGASPARDSYLVIEKIIAAAKQTGAQAIHPGYGFLSENADFCLACKDNNLVFIGPPVAAIEAMGSKSNAKNIMENADVPLIPGYHGDNQDPVFLKQTAEEIGYPVLLKATAGGGGKGMRQVWSTEEFDDALAAAKREAMSSFADDTMLIEKYFTQPRHVEIQVFCDQHSNAVFLAERDCSVQRRHQKVIEEAPAPGISQKLRKQMGKAAIRAAQAIDYQGAGTVEFLLDKDNTFYFMEMNTRLQVEHPVTEMITNQDLVEWQLRTACGETLPLKQEEITICGHAFEARIYAEDPDKDFLPATGTLTFLQPPEEDQHVRIDTGVLQGDEVSVYYDPMIAKLIVWDEDRDRALQRLAKALREYRINGMTTNLEFLYNLSSSPAFQKADLETGFIDKHHQEIFHDGSAETEENLTIAALYLTLQRAEHARLNAIQSNDPHSPWNYTDAWRLNEAHTQSYQLLCHEQEYPVSVEQVGRGSAIRYQIKTGERSVYAQGRLEGNILHADIDGYRQRVTVSEHDGYYTLYMLNSALQFSQIEHDMGENLESHNDNGLCAPMNGTLVEIIADLNKDIKKDEPLLVMEAMKMEHTIRAPADGKVIEFYYQAGDLVNGGVELLQFETSEKEN